MPAHLATKAARKQANNEVGIAGQSSNSRSAKKTSRTAAPETGNDSPDTPSTNRSHSLRRGPEPGVEQQFAVKSARNEVPSLKRSTFYRPQTPSGSGVIGRRSPVPFQRDRSGPSGSVGLQHASKRAQFSGDHSSPFLFRLVASPGNRRTMSKTTRGQAQSRIRTSPPTQDLPQRDHSKSEPEFVPSSYRPVSFRKSARKVTRNQIKHATPLVPDRFVSDAARSYRQDPRLNSKRDLRGSYSSTGPRITARVSAAQPRRRLNSGADAETVSVLSTLKHPDRLGVYFVESKLTRVWMEDASEDSDIDVDILDDHGTRHEGAVQPVARRLDLHSHRRTTPLFLDDDSDSSNGGPGHSSDTAARSRSPSDHGEDDVYRFHSPGLGLHSHRRTTPLFLDDDSDSSNGGPGHSSDTAARSRSPSDHGEDDVYRFHSPGPRSTDTENGDYAPPNEILDALESLSLSSIHLQATKRLPFLPRTLRRGFAHRCSLVGVVTTPKKPSDIVKVVFQRGKKHSYVGQMASWRCPVCDLHGHFANRIMLEKHLQWDHSEVDVVWEEIDEVWKLTLDLPDPDICPERPCTKPLLLFEDHGPIPLSSRPDIERKPVAPTSFLSATSSTLATPSTSRATSEMAVVRAACEDDPDELNGRTMVDQETPAGFGPTAKYPFLPSTHFSCRPGGPRLFDLIALEPMAPYGVLAWQVEERDECIFEVDDLRDEDKVMQSLWARWIFMNKSEFIRNYYDATIKFVETYSRQIKEAAGWGSLRVLVMVLAANRFLNGEEAANVMRHYQKLVDMPPELRS